MLDCKHKDFDTSEFDSLLDDWCPLCQDEEMIVDEQALEEHAAERVNMVSLGLL